MSVSKLLNILSTAVGLKDPIKDLSKIQLVRDYVFMTNQWYHNYISGTSFPFFLRECSRDPYNDGNAFQLQWSYTSWKKLTITSVIDFITCIIVSLKYVTPSVIQLFHLNSWHYSPFLLLSKVTNFCATKIVLKKEKSQLNK